MHEAINSFFLVFCLFVCLKEKGLFFLFIYFSDKKNYSRDHDIFVKIAGWGRQVFKRKCWRKKKKKELQNVRFECSEN